MFLRIQNPDFCLVLFEVLPNMTFQNNTSQCQGWTFSISKISFFKMLISDFCHVTFTFISWLSPWQPCLIHCSVPVCVNMLSLMTCCHLILLHVRFLPFKTFKLRNNLWETHCRLDLLIFMTEGLIHFFCQDFQHVWGQNSFVPQEEVACYLMSAPLQLTALMWEPADRAKPSHEPHRYDIVMHYLFTRSILRARFLYIYRFN